jgi:hypothetical protein
MAVRDARDPWRALWQHATDAQTLAVLLGLTGVLLSAAAVLPQVTADDPALRARQLFQAQAQFGSATATLQALGLLRLTRSAALRVALALLASCLALRLADGAEALWRLRRPGPRGERSTAASCAWLPAALSLAAHAGALLVLLGLLLTHLGGWRLEGVVLQPGERLALGHGTAWVALDAEGVRLAHSPGLTAHVQERGPGVRVRARDAAGAPLPMLQTPEAQPAQELLLALRPDPTSGAREAQFAVPAAGLVVRLAPQANTEQAAPLLVQAYRSPSGELASEERLAAGAGDVWVGDVRLEIAAAPYRVVAVAHSPGRWPGVIGLGLLALGLAGSAAHGLLLSLAGRAPGSAAPEGARRC